MKFSFVANLIAVPFASGVTLRQATTSTAAANPIRKVVNLLQKMQKRVTDERDEAGELYEKFMCYCRSSGGGLQKSIDAGEEKVPALESDIKAAQGKLGQLKEDLKSNQEDSRGAKASMDQGTSLREKEKVAFDKAFAENRANLGAAQKAVVAVEQGMGGSFVQTSSAASLRAFLGSAQGIAMDSTDREQLSSFLSGQFAPGTGEINGILKTLVDEMTQDKEQMVATETKAIADYKSLMESKTKEVKALQKSIEEGMERISETSVAIATMKNDLEDTSAGLEQDKKFASDLKTDCTTKGDVHAKEQEVRGQELVALADTIKILNADDALELFKKTLPSASASLLQVRRSSSSELSNTLSSLVHANKRHRLDFVLLALRGKKVGFDKIIKFIDQLVAALSKEAGDDEIQKGYCQNMFDQFDDEKKDHERTLANTNTVIEDAKESIATLASEIKALEAGIVALDKSLTEATEQRKAETKEYRDLIASNSAAKELILFAKNRLNKFYNPKLYKAPPKAELSRDDRIYENNMAFVQFDSRRVVSPPPPETAAAYAKKSEENGGVIAMMDLLVADLEKQMTEAKTQEENNQEEYEQVVKDSAEKRTQDSRSLTDKEGAKADLENSWQEHKVKEKATNRDLLATERAIGNLHAECDWLLKYFDVREAARNDEVDALHRAKATLSGADYSLL